MRQLDTRYFEESSFEELFFQLLSDPAMELQAAVLNGEIVGFVSLRYHLALNHGLAAALEEIVVGGRQRDSGVGGEEGYGEGLSSDGSGMRSSSPSGP